MNRNSFINRKNILGMLSVLAFTLLVGCKGNGDVERGNMDSGKEYTKAFFIGDTTVPVGAEFIEISSVSLVVNLAGTGSDPPESVQRTMLLREMASQEVMRPAEVLADPNTSMVIVTGYLPPGVKKGDRFDVEVTLPSDSETTSLRGGFLLEAPMRELLYKDGLHEGSKRGYCSGPVLVEPKTGTDRDKVTQRRGKVLGGGVSTFERFIELRVKSTAVKPDKHMTMKIEHSINTRFKSAMTSTHEKVAKAKTDKYLVLTIPPVYKENINRFVDVVRCMPILETEAQRLDRMKLLEKKLLDPTTTKRAALELEAIGKIAIDTLKLGLMSEDAYVQFESAQALAYLDVNDGAEILGKTALNDRVHRGHALLALSVMNDLNAYEVLRDLMSAPTAETRYGAFRALRVMRPTDALVAGELLGNRTFTLCVVPSTGKPMLHVTKSNRAEVVLFGENQMFKHPMTIEAANNIIVRTSSPTEVTVSRFEVNRPDQRRVVSCHVEDVIRALSDVGATYPDVLEVLQAAIEQNALDTSFRIDALPKTGRSDPYETRRKDEERQKVQKVRKIRNETDILRENVKITQCILPKNKNH
ncbi:MAG: flagellar basal body P-ring protein FlgI [Planctomycetia bacterium]|nr:flagellar basal body P-ring protein FlgI [Planctomycetia bacterium]